jgi:TPP-dependent 2-oxoacid decarboxylase
MSVGSYVAERLVQGGGRDYFTVPGDFTLGLLDCLLQNKVELHRLYFRF